jgi:hypothetical protein
MQTHKSLALYCLKSIKMKFEFLSVKTLFLLFVLLMISDILLGQQTTAKGLVKSQEGEPLNGVTVTIRDKDSTVIGTSVTNASGTFSLSNLKAGTSYTMILSHVGYENYVVNNYCTQEKTILICHFNYRFQVGYLKM